MILFFPENYSIIYFINDYKFLLIGTVLFFSGFSQFLFLTNKNFLIAIIASELMMLGLSFLFIHLFIFSLLSEAVIYALIIVVLSVVEVAVGLSVSILLFKYHRTLELDEIVAVKL